MEAERHKKRDNMLTSMVEHHNVRPAGREKPPTISCRKRKTTTITPPIMLTKNGRRRGTRRTKRQLTEEGDSACGRRKARCTKLFKKYAGVFLTFPIKCWVHLASAQILVYCNCSRVLLGAPNNIAGAPNNF